MRRNIWTADHVKLMIECIDKGLSAGQTSKIIGHGFSRCAVQGKAFRLGLSFKGGLSKSETNTIRVKRKASESVRDKKRRSTPRPINDFPRLPVPLPEPIAVEQANIFPLVHGLPMALMEHQQGQCKWPIGHPKDPDFHYCTNQASGTYCEGHRALSKTAAYGTVKWFAARLEWARQNPTFTEAKAFMRKHGIAK